MKILVNALHVGVHALAGEWKYEIACLHCTSRLEVEAKDLKFQSDQHDGDSYTFRCPVCGGACWIEASIVPRGLVHP